MEREINGITIKEENGVVTYVGGTPSTLDIANHGGYISYTGDESSGDGVLVCTEDENGTLDHTWQEIHDAKYAIVRFDSGDRIDINQILAVISNNNPPSFKVESYRVATDDNSKYFLERELYVAQSANDYPVYA